MSSSLSSSGRLLYTRGPSCRIRSLQLSNEIDSGRRKGPYIEDRNLYFKGHIECLLSVSSHLQVTIHELATIYSQGLFKEETGLVPVGCWGSWPCRQCHILLRSFEYRIKVDGIAVNKSSRLNSMLEEEIYNLKIFQCTPAFKVENKSVWNVAQTKVINKLMLLTFSEGHRCQ